MLPVVLGLLQGLGCTVVPDEDYCASDEDCQQRPGGMNSVCDEVLRICEPVPPGGCRRDEQCTNPERPRCDRTRSECVPCIPLGDSSTAPECAHFSDPPRPHCIQQGGGTRCVECLTHLDCPVSRPICDGHSCRPCREHRECGPETRCDDGTDQVGKPCRNSWVCISPDDGDDLKDRAGRCASNNPRTGRVVYAQHFPVMSDRCRDNWPGTYDQPRCTIDAAVARVLEDPARLRYLRLLGTIFPAPQQPLRGRDLRLVIVGAETKSLIRATVQDTRVLFQIGDGATVVLDQIRLIQDRPDTTAIRCSSGPGLHTSLTVRRSLVLGSTTDMNAGTQPAIFSSECDTSLLNSYVGAMEEGQPGHSVGVQLVGSDQRSYQIVGNIVAGNRGPALLLSAATLKFAFNTVVGNGRPGVFGGIDCSFGMALRLAHSIVVGNSRGMGIGQFSGSCSFDRVVVWPAPLPLAQGQIGASPELDRRFHLQPTSTACLDQVPPAPDLPERDIDGDVRPQGPALDIGADELVR